MIKIDVREKNHKIAKKLVIMENVKNAKKDTILIRSMFVRSFHRIVKNVIKTVNAASAKEVILWTKIGNVFLLTVSKLMIQDNVPNVNKDIG